MKNAILFILAVMIWGSTWLVITYQLGTVHPLVSVAYRFAIASIILLGYCYWKKLFQPLPLKTHGFLTLQGICLFGLNYWAVYTGEHYITSALAAVLSTVIIYFNILFGWLLLNKSISKEVVMGALVGIGGVVLLFMPELTQSELSNETVAATTWLGIFLVLGGSVLASLGNITSAYTQSIKVAVTHANALSMSYATVFLFVMILVLDIPITFETTPVYIASLFYLAIFGSVIAFWAYLTLVGNIGADKAGYAVLVYPAIALILSSWFENYQWQWQSFAGLAFIVVGNLIAMNKWRHVNTLLRIANTRIRG
ncbi:MAG: EamA family transporter [Gammaproteobacteria bacterium]|nr:EamA family transporter [Gammaproteobacteria bacterium]